MKLRLKKNAKNYKLRLRLLPEPKQRVRPRLVKKNNKRDKKKKQDKLRRKRLKDKNKSC